MKKLLSIYKNIIIQQISYEKGDDSVELKCVLVFAKKTVQTTLIITQSDFNRILSKLSINGCELDSNLISNYFLEDGTEIVDYNFSSENEQNKLQHFNFNYKVQQISA